MTTHLDIEMLSELREIMQDDYTELLETYLEDAVTRLESIELAASSNDSEWLRDSAHSFKGSSSNIGATRLAELTQSVEYLAKENQVDEVLPMLEDIRSEYGVVRTLIEAELAQAQSGGANLA
mgnify:CR=1 FL=1